MTYKLVLDIPALPKRYNQGMGSHWTTRHAEVRKWRNLISLAMISSGQKAPSAPLAKAEIILTRFSSVEPDFDNLCQSFKCAVDSLKFHGIIKDDKMSVIGQPIYNWKKVAPKKGAIRIEVTG
jgi:Holliday junction resolvase RusA-like endonuclease